MLFHSERKKENIDSQISENKNMKVPEHGNAPKLDDWRLENSIDFPAIF